MSATIRILAVAFGLFGPGAPVIAHHAFSSEYRRSQGGDVEGTVTKIEWTNPHARFFIDVTNPDKTVTSWSFELASPNSLTREGWDRHTLTVGDAITVSGFAAKSGKTMASTRTVTTAEGKALFGGTQGIQ